MEEWKGKRMGGWKIGSAKPFKTIKILIGVIDLEVCGPSQPWNSKKSFYRLARRRGTGRPPDQDRRFNAAQRRIVTLLQRQLDLLFWPGCKLIAHDHPGTGIPV